MTPDAARTHLETIRTLSANIRMVLGTLDDRELLDEAHTVDTARQNLTEIMRRADALAALAKEAQEEEPVLWGVAPRSVDYARRHPWKVIPCPNREAAEQVRNEQGDREHWIVVQIRRVITAAQPA